MALGEVPHSNEVRRQEIISASPTMQAILLRDVTQPFLNDRYADVTHAIVEKHQKKLRRIIGSSDLRDQARSTIDMKIQDTIDIFNSFGFIDTQRNATDPEADKLLKQISETLLFAGFEIDDADDVRLVEDDIIQYLKHQDENSGGKFFSDEAREMLREEGGQIMLHNTINQILLFGVNIRVYQTLLPLKVESESKVDTNANGKTPQAHTLPDPLDGWVNDIPGLDKL